MITVFPHSNNLLMLKEMPKNQKEVSMCVCIFIVMAMIYDRVGYDIIFLQPRSVILNCFIHFIFATSSRIFLLLTICYGISFICPMHSKPNA